MRQDSVSHSILAPDLEARVAILRKQAAQIRLILPTDVALYIAQNVRSNECTLGGALTLLRAYSSLTGTLITLQSTQHLLGNFCAAEARKFTVDPLQKLPSVGLGTRETRIKGQDLAAADCKFDFCLVEARDRRKTSQVRHELE